MDNNSGLSTVLVAVLLVVIVGGGIWYLSRSENNGPEEIIVPTTEREEEPRDINVDVDLPPTGITSTSEMEVREGEVATTSGTD